MTSVGWQKRGQSKASVDQQNKQDYGQEKDDDILHYKGCISLIIDLLALSNNTTEDDLSKPQPIVYADMYSLANFLLTAEQHLWLRTVWKKSSQDVLLGPKAREVGAFSHLSLWRL